jgi:hypothetical protein
MMARLPLQFAPLPRTLAHYDERRIVGIHVPTQWGKVSKERRDAYPLGRQGAWAYYQLVDGDRRRYVRLHPEQLVALQRPEFVPYADLPQPCKQIARRLRQPG